MIPITKAKMSPRRNSFINGFRTKNAMSAPNGSDNPESKAYLKAFALLPVE